MTEREVGWSSYLHQVKPNISEFTEANTDFSLLNSSESTFGPAEHPHQADNIPPQQAEESLDAFRGLPGSGRLLCQYQFHVSSSLQFWCCKSTPYFQQGRLLFSQLLSAPSWPVPPSLYVPLLRASWLEKAPHAPRLCALLSQSLLCLEIHPRWLFFLHHSPLTTPLSPLLEVSPCTDPPLPPPLPPLSTSSDFQTCRLAFRLCSFLLSASCSLTLTYPQVFLSLGSSISFLW